MMKDDTGYATMAHTLDQDITRSVGTYGKMNGIKMNEYSNDKLEHYVPMYPLD